MRSTLLYVVPIVFTAGSALAQQYGEDPQFNQNPMYITNGAGPVQVYNRRPPPNLVEADGPNALYPVKSYVIERQPIVLPAPNVNVQNTIVMPERKVYVKPAAPRPRIHKPRPPCQCKM